jgi:hypothetical protein
MPHLCTAGLALGLALGLLAPGRLMAQPAQGAATPELTLPGSAGQTCVQVKVAGQKPSAYNCLNQQMQQYVQRQSQPQPNPPVSAGSQPNQVGSFNEQSVAEQYGKNFGISAVPYRPPPPVYSNSIGPSR